MPIQQDVRFRDFNFGGLSLSRFYGSKNQFARAVGFDIHSSPGLLKVNQKMSKTSGSTVTELCKAGFTASNGIRYWFSADSGKIWQDKAGTFTLVYTAVPAAGEAKCLGAAEYQGYIYWATESRLHRIATASADGAANWTANVALNWATFTKTDNSYHPMREINLVLFIGDGNQIAQVDAGVFSANAMDMSTGFRVTALAAHGTSLVIGTIISSSVNLCSIFYWNTWSTLSFSFEEVIKTNGINSFLEGEDFTLFSAGRAGKLYVMGGIGNKSRHLKYGSVPGTFSPTKTGIIYPAAWGVYQGRLIFGFSNVAGNPADQGIYSFVQVGDVAVRNLEFPISQTDGDGYNIISSVEIGAIIVEGDDVYCSWKDSTGTPAYGVDKLDYSNKIAKPFMELPVVAPDRSTMHNFTMTSVHYASLPTDTSIVIKSRKNLSGSFSSAETVKDDTDRVVVYNDEVHEAKALEARIECVSSGNNAPEIEEIVIRL